MERSDIVSILNELNLSEQCVANIYNYGSWVYGTNSASSDRDIMIVTRSPHQDPLVFQQDLDYFHQFELHKLWDRYDVCVHSIENFEILLKKSYLLAVECIFLPDEFKIKEEIDFRSIYLEKYFNPLRIKQVALYENLVAIQIYDLNDESIYPIMRSSRSGRTNQSRIEYLFKNLFHGFRYLDIAEQLIKTRSIHDFKRVSHILNEMKYIRGDLTNDISYPVLDFIREKSNEYKPKLDELVPNIVKGTFEAHITFDCTHNTEDVIEKLQKTCENTKYKIIFIDLETKKKNERLQQLMTSSYHCGEYPLIVKQIEQDAYEYFKHFNILRIKVESLASNQGIPQTDLEKKNDSHGSKLKELRDLSHSYHTCDLHLSCNAFKQIDENSYHYLITTRLFDVGQDKAFELNDDIIRYLTAQSDQN